MRTWKESIEMFRYNLSSVVLFEIIYKLLSLSVLLPVINAILNYSVKLADVGFISTGYVNKYMSSPSTYILLLVVIALIGIYVLINMSALIYAMESSHRREKTNALILFIKGFGNAIRVINPKNFGILLHAILIIPCTYTVMISGSLLGMRIPAFVLKILSKNKIVVGIIVAVYLALGLATMFRIYVLNYYTLYKLNYREAVRMSRNTVKRHVFGRVIGVLIYNFVLMLVLVLLEGSFALVFAGIAKNILPYKQLTFFVDSSIQILFVLFYILFSLISTPLVYSFICAGFYSTEGDGQYEEYKRVKQRRQRDDVQTTLSVRKKHVFSVFIIIISTLLNGLYVYLVTTNKVILNFEYSTYASVTAHRGDAKNAPENTMAAFELALENQADIIELDVRQTKDGEFIIMHDESLLRTTGVDKKVGELTFEEIEKIDAGIKFSKNYAGERIPTLQEVLDFAVENDIELNIELKPAETDINFVLGIVNILEINDFVDKCVVACADYDTLKELKSLNPDITTVYIMGAAFGQFGGMEDIDIFSVRHTFVNAGMVRDIHAHGKKIYAWTLEKEENIKRMLLLDVDSIITDDPYTTKDLIHNANDSILSDFLKRLIEEY